ncbi:hypothetical protein ADM98_11770 [Exiguobacterium sp. BMC-KP]|nr:hypothetical protein ADM98_11770 [Exiguobacterium sp. BMC-KP]
MYIHNKKILTRMSQDFLFNDLAFQLLDWFCMKMRRSASSYSIVIMTNYSSAVNSFLKKKWTDFRLKISPNGRVNNYHGNA